MISLRLAGPSSTMLLNSIVDNGIVNDIVDEIVTCDRVFSLRPLRAHIFTGLPLVTSPVILRVVFLPKGTRNVVWYVVRGPV